MHAMMEIENSARSPGMDSSLGDLFLQTLQKELTMSHAQVSETQNEVETNRVELSNCAIAEFRKTSCQYFLQW